MLVLTHEFAPSKGGIATFTEEMARAATQLGHEVEVWAPHARNCDDEKFPFLVKRLKLKGSQDISCQLKLARELIANRRLVRQADLYLTDPGPILAMRLLQFLPTLRPKKLFITFHGSETQTFAANPFTRLTVNRLLKRADRISTPSAYTQSLLERAFPAARGKSILTPCALGSNFLESDTPKQPPTQKIRILTVGRLHPRKGQAATLEALAALPLDLQKRIEYWIVGPSNDSRYANRLEAQAQAANLDVTFFGDTSDDQLAQLYAQADIFALNSMPFRKSVEGFGLVYLEAAAHGLPIVAHDIGGVSEAVSHQQNGILVDPSAREELTAVFARIIQDPDLRNRLSQAGPTWARQNSWQESAEKLFGRA